jgi:hypothetical protein
VTRIAELEQAIRDERQAEAQRQKAAEAAQRAREAERRQAETDLAKTVAAIEKVASGAMERAQQIAGKTPPPGMSQRLNARMLLIGTLTAAAGPFGEPQAVVNAADPAAAVIWDALDQAQRARRAVEEQLGGHPLTGRADHAECMLWRAYLGRLRVIAGEAG